MTAFYESSDTQRSRSDRPRTDTRNGRNGAGYSSNGNGRRNGNGRSNGSRSAMDARDLQDAVKDLKDELERSGRPDRFVIEKMELIEQFASTLPFAQGAGGTVNGNVWGRLGQELQQVRTVGNVWGVLCGGVQEGLDCDRVAIYQFGADWSGEFVAEVVGSGWPEILGSEVSDRQLRETEGGQYARGQSVLVSDIYDVDVYSVDYQSFPVQFLERCETKAYGAVPLQVGDTLWGLLMVFQNDEPRSWSAEEVGALEQVATQAAAAIERLQKDERDRALSQVTQRIRASLELATIFDATTQEMRRLLKADRVGIYRFNADWSGQFVSESVGSTWTKLIDLQKRDQEMGSRIGEASDCSTLEGLRTQTYQVQDTYLMDNQGGRYQDNQAMVVNDVTRAGFPECYLAVLRTFEAQAYATVPIFQGKKLWGLLATYQCSGARRWQSTEVDFMTNVSTQLGLAISQAEAFEALKRQNAQNQQAAKREAAIANIVNKMRASLDIDAIFRTTTLEVRRLLNGDRVGIYKFNEDWSGQFVAESVATGWKKLIELQKRDDDVGAMSDCDTLQTMQAVQTIEVQDTYLMDNMGGRYQDNQNMVVNDVTKAGFSQCYLNVLKKFQAQAYTTVPIFQGDKLWGLLAVYQCSGPRQWQDSEVSFVAKIGTQLGLALDQAEAFRALRLQSEQNRRAAEREATIANVINKIRASLDIDAIFRATTQEVRRLLESDRVGIYKFNPDWSGQFVAESVDTGWKKLIELQKRDDDVGAMSDCDTLQTMQTVQTLEVQDTYLMDNMGGRYRDNQNMVVNDVTQAGFSQCYLNVLEKFQAQAYTMVPIFQGDTLWGLLAVYQCSGPRQWQDSEVSFVSRIGAQLGLALDQAESLTALRRQNAVIQKAVEREAAISGVIDKIRASLDIGSIFRTTTQEVRRLLEGDRVGIYRFNEDWSGEFVAESVGGQWKKLIEEQAVDGSLKDNISTCETMERMRVQTAEVQDTYLMDQEGGRYRQGKSISVNDIYKAGFTDCYLEVLERFQAKAYAMAPIIRGDQLWGLLAVYQNSGPRQWEQSEIDFVVQVAAQLGLALKQAESLNALKRQSEQLEAAAQRDKSAREDLQQKALNLLLAVRPALEGDLTVRAPITDDEVGTIADAYNNTLQSLRQIVVQLQDTASKVSDTSQSSSGSMTDLAGKSQNQYEALTEALNQVQDMASATAAVTDSAQQVNAAVQQATATIATGDEAMDQTVDAILSIRDTVAETGRKIRALSDSSQKISKIVNLIGNFTTQTQLLALNAAIEATRAGEYGRGFTVVADEVRSLAQQSAAATTEIEALVAEIQSETSAVAEAMETGIQQVAEGTSLVSSTRQSLSDVVAVTAQIETLVQTITQASQTQTEQAESVTQTVEGVAAIADTSSKESAALAEEFEALLTISQELQTSVGRFKVQ
ncbi:MAG: GAF domain-containing protein [Cyanophyceae cyanobacterium]